MVQCGILAALLAATTAWYGPSTVDAALPTTGNPFSPIENDVRCVFTARGHRDERLAYYAHGKWHATLSAIAGGTYAAQFMVNGKPTGAPLKATLAPAEDGEFVRLGGTRFETASGKPYVPLGHDFGWESGVPYPKQLADMRAAGLNWTRVWADAWDGKNPYVPRDPATKLPLGRMDESALDRWDMVVRESEKDAIRFQFVLFHHGLFSTTTDSNWAQHPWNRANGGFLADPKDFFTDPTAKALAKAWLRYAVARWGHSPAIMAWELFNEVQWTDAAKDPAHIGDVVAWHREMGDYVRSIDPYHHLVTSSSSESLDARVFASMDYLQPHTYPPSITGALLGTPAPKDRPLFYGELGLGGPGGDERLAVRDGIWGGLLAGHAGPGQYWYWDRVYKNGLYAEYAREAKILARSGFAENPAATPAPIAATGGRPSDLVLRPGRGWAKTDRAEYRLPDDAPTGALPLLSGFMQGTAHRDMTPGPLRLRFTAKTAGEARLVVSQTSGGGAALRASVNGAPVVSRTWTGTGRENAVKETVDVPFPAGPVEITLENPGTDWFVLDSVTLPGVGSGVSAASLRTDRYALARLVWTGGIDATPKRLSMPGLLDGTYELRRFDLDAGTERDSRVAVKAGLLQGYVPLARDEALALFRKS